MPDTENSQPQPDRSGFSGADKLKRLGRGVKRTGVVLGVTTIAAAGVNAMRPGGGEPYTATGPHETLIQSETTAPAEGTPADAEQLATILEQLKAGTMPNAEGVIGSLQLGDTDQGVLVLHNALLVPQPKDSDRIVIGGATAEGHEAAYVLDTKHFAINLVSDEASGPVAQSYAEAKALVKQHSFNVSIDTDPVHIGGPNITGTTEDPDETSLTLGRIEFISPDNEAELAQS